MAIGDKLINSKDLVVESFSLIKKDKSLLIPPFLSFFLTLLVTAAIFVLFSIPAKIGSTGVGVLLFLLIPFVILLHFVNAFFNAALTWMVLEAKQGKDTTLGQGMARAFKNFFDIFMFALASLAITMIAGAIRGGEKERNYARDMAANAVQRAWKIAGSLILPSMILTENTFFSAWKEIKDYKDSIPQILVGEFGLGMAFSIISGLAGIFTLGAFFINTYFGIAMIALVLIPLNIFRSLIQTIFYTLLYIQIKKLA